MKQNNNRTKSTIAWWAIRIGIAAGIFYLVSWVILAKIKLEENQDNHIISPTEKQSEVNVIDKAVFNHIKNQENVLQSDK